MIPAVTRGRRNGSKQEAIDVDIFMIRGIYRKGFICYSLLAKDE